MTEKFEKSHIILIKVGCCDGTTSRYSSCIFPQSKHKPTENQVEPTKHHRERDKERKGKGRKSFITKCTKNRTSTLPQFCQLAEWKYCIGLSTELILLLQKFRYSIENVTKEKWWGYCALSGGIGSYVFLAFMSQPFWKMHQSNCKTRGTGYGHTKSWPSSKPQWWGWKRAAAYSGGFEMRYCAT